MIIVWPALQPTLIADTAGSAVHCYTVITIENPEYRQQTGSFGFNQKQRWSSDVETTERFEIK